MIQAAKNNHIQQVNRLIGQGVDLNFKDRVGKTALMYASHNGHVDVVRALINAGADVHTRDLNDMTALMYASHNGHVDVVRALINAGADVNAISQYNNNSTVLMYTVLHERNIGVMRVLIDAGADIDAVNIFGDTSLMLASSNGYVEIVRALIQKGADTNIRNNNGDTALTMARNKQIRKVIIDARKAEEFKLERIKHDARSYLQQKGKVSRRKQPVVSTKQYAVVRHAVAGMNDDTFRLLSQIIGRPDTIPKDAQQRLRQRVQTGIIESSNRSHRLK